MDYIPENYIKGKIQPIPINNVLKYSSKANATCKVLLNNKIGSGFFTKVKILNEQMLFLFTNNHILGEENIKNNSIIKILNDKKIKEIKINEDRFTCTNEELDYTCIEIFEDEDIDNFFEIDNKINCEDPYEEYKNDNIVIIQYPKGEDVSFAEGNIKNIKNQFQIYHSVSTEFGSSGSPIILNKRNLKIIGIHCGYVKKDNVNRGVFFKQIIDNVKNHLINFERKTKNEIICIYEIDDCDINKNNQILNKFTQNKKFNNEKSFKDNMNLYIDNKKILFGFTYKFIKKGKYKLKILIKKELENIRWMFKDCKKLFSLDFSNFNSNNLIDIQCLFYECSSLTSINFSNFNTEKIEKMNNLFYNCSSLRDLNINNFNTQNVTDMSFMFFKCSSLKNLNISNFNTENVTDMSFMFCGCTSLKDLNLDNFNTQNVTDMKFMFCKCSSLKNLNLSNFNTENVVDMNNMFSNCLSLKKLDISNFNFKYVKDKDDMFNGIDRIKCLIKFPGLSKIKIKLIQFFILIIIPFIIYFIFLI